MKPSTREWVAKAEEDFLAAQDLARRRKLPLWSSVCFHAQDGPTDIQGSIFHFACRRTALGDAFMVSYQTVSRVSSSSCMVLG